ncbi:MAG: shikimate kinase [Blautia sp.]|nr:shikimate kinase [Blautia sp.]
MNHIVIIGFMGSGKTKVGKRLAKDYNLPFIDLDKVVAKKMKMPISEIFKKMGEPFYRAMETYIVKALIEDKERKVVCLGAGCPMQEQNAELIPQLGTVIYLKGTPQVLIEKIKEKQGNPIEREETTVERLTAKIESRDPQYGKLADIKVSISTHSFDAMIETIEKKLSDLEKKSEKK